jgi:hypothetical protein
MSGFTKLVPEIVLSSIWNESPEVRCVWIALLATKDKDGNVRGNPRSLARVANVPVEAVDESLDIFQRPDSDSNNPDSEGRRIEAIPGGWHIVSHDIYRAKDYREHEAERKQAWRKNRAMSGTSPGQVPDCSVSVSASPSVSEQVAEGDAKGSGKTKAKGIKAPYKGEPIPQALQSVVGFEKEWAAFLDNRKAKGAKATARAQELLLATLEQRPAQAVEALREAITRNWTGIKWEWLDNRSNGGKPTAQKLVNTWHDPNPDMAMRKAF